MLSIILFFASCATEQKFIYYTYKNITISRLDNGNEIFLYFGKQKDINSLPKSYVKARYSGFDGLMSCYLIFRENGSVDIINIEGHFDTIKTGEKMRLMKFNSNIDFIKWNDKIKDSYNNIIELSDVLKNEIKRNKKNNSKVEASYPKE